MHPLFIAADNADKAFTANLIRQFGKDACNKRYQTRYHDAETQAASVEFHRAMDAWLPVARIMLVA